MKSMIERPGEYRLRCGRMARVVDLNDEGFAIGWIGKVPGVWATVDGTTLIGQQQWRDIVVPWEEQVEPAREDA